MVKRILDCTASDFAALTPQELKQAIYAGEGRTILSENIVTQPPLVEDVTNSELARSAGADLILLNAIDLNEPQIQGLPATDQPLQLLKKLVGRPVGVNLEPVSAVQLMSAKKTIISGRQATQATLQKAEQLGADYVCLTGNPGTGVANQQILKTIQVAKQTFHGLIIAGKMHSSGVNEPIMTATVAQQFIDGGVDILLVPAVYTVPHWTEADLSTVIRIVQKHNAQANGSKNKVLTMATIGTSQESSTPAVIRQIALADKALGVDIHHIGDGGFSGLAPYQNIDILGNTVRGARHQLRRRAQSILR
ncbi:hypothetical protein IV38_GL000218 [Lactobacillus selangorensis]|uniref:DUF7916 domain-containing protein n=1 Tax=Lactobacillus selangorensis TaxID=81857 RepID=A0A0R2G0U8_9LACO|nr:hypothetical protein [Lactobacillus selangorensis]KRN29335.1 hypothetical protein IV38_GL000218 [Lactobacillus selangorensis]KRN34136.1 hypothetical protein IV40_GL000451 [Lactobacillus selangorensis]